MIKDISVVSMIFLFIGIIGATMLLSVIVYELFILLFKRKKKAGSIVINTKDPEKDVIRIELDISVGELIKEKKVVFHVVNEE